MDISETYVKMCEGAEEIQEGWTPTNWDWVYCKVAEKEDSNPVVLSGYDVDGGYYGHSSEPECGSPVSNGAYREGKRVFRDEHFWLPRQDQLQEVMGDKWTVPWLARNIWGFFKTQFYPHSIYDKEGTYPTDWEPTSMEQLWLAFVMKEKFGKAWNGEEWI